MFNRVGILLFREFVNNSTGMQKMLQDSYGEIGRRVATTFSVSNFHSFKAIKKIEMPEAAAKCLKQRSEDFYILKAKRALLK